MFWDVCYIFYLEKLFVINKHEMTITSQKYTFDPGLRYEVQQTKFLSFWAIFCPFTPLTIQKIKRDIIILHKCTKNHDHMLYCYWDMVCDKCNYFSFGLFFAVLPPSSLKNHNIKKIKKPWRYIIILHKYTKNHGHMLYCSWDHCYFSF